MGQVSDDIGLLTRVASLYYEENYTQERIARIVGISRSGISRLLTRSRELGLVDIKVHHQLRTSSSLRDTFMSQFGLQDARILLGVSPDESLLTSVAELAARYLDHYIQEAISTSERNGIIVGISWGMLLFEVVRALQSQRRHALDVVQLMGSLGIPSLPRIDGPEIACQLADVYGANYHSLHAPLLVATSLMREVLVEEQSLARTFQMMEQIDVAIVSIDGTRQGTSELLRTGYLAEDDLRLIRSQEAIGTMPGCYFTLEGTICATSLLDRTISISFDTLCEIPIVIAVAVGPIKAEAVLGALRTGSIDVLITDEFCARAVLSYVADAASS